ncbi:MAG TPA: ribulose-phosphate 3-epimerase [Thermoanaerobaculia bacterium]|nr:ribulose-phosphate 3-epimerase [Thermoanaerobaculia bacterium]
MKIAPSIFASDLADLGSGLAVCEQGGVEVVHVDVMDGHFVPNLTFGPPVISALAKRTRLALDVHLMVAHPDRLLDLYLEAGARWISVHWEALTHVDRTIERIREAGRRAGIALNPATPAAVLDDILPALDFVLLMSVNPGFSGQRFIPYVLDKAHRLRATIDERGLDVELEIDGGVAEDNLHEVREAGVDVSVIGSGIFGTDDPVATTRRLRERAAEPR